MIEIKSAREIIYLRKAGKIVAYVLNELKKAVAPGISTQELDKIAEKLIYKKGGKPAFKGYRNYPATICTSVNEQVVHGLPSSYKLRPGDIISIDVGVVFNGYYGDGAITVPVGEIDHEAQRLIKVTETALALGIAQAKKNNRVLDISAAIQQYVEKHGYNVVRDFFGHGIGRNLQEEPIVPNFVDNCPNPILKPGMVLAIEPMVNMGTYEVEIMPDGWTVITKDRKLSAHFEHTVLITEYEPEILTQL